MNNKEPLLSTSDLVKIILSIIISAVSVAAYAFTTFETKSSHERFEDQFLSRFERLESKIDKLLEMEKK
jgi:hypothetical protein